MDALVLSTLLVVWRFTTVDSGGLCVMMPGLQQTLKWLAVSLGFLSLQPDLAQVLLQSEILLALHSITSYIVTYQCMHLNVQCFMNISLALFSVPIMCLHCKQ